VVLQVSRNWLQRLLDREHLVRFDIFEALNRSARPRDLDQSHSDIAPETKMRPLIICRGVAGCGAHEPMLFGARFPDHSNAGADAVAVAARSYRIHQQPMVRASTPVDEDQRLAVVAVDRDVHKAVVVQVAEGRTARGERGLEDRSALARPESPESRQSIPAAVRGNETMVESTRCYPSRDLERQTDPSSRHCRSR